MKAICIRSFGGLDVLRLEELPDPQPRTPTEVVVRIRAASVNAADWKVRTGESLQVTFPHVLGRDFSGVVEAAGPDSDLQVGDEVFGVCPTGMEGAYAERIAMESRLLAHKPASLSHREAAALGLAALTALVSLEDTLAIRRGERVFIQGGAGGVGGMAVQLAKAHGCWVAATARVVNHDYLRDFGADLPIDYTREDPVQLLGDIDAALDTVGGRTVAQTFGVLRAGGRAAFVGVRERPRAPHAGVTSLRPDVVRGRELLERVLAHVKAGALRAPDIHVMPLADAARAHELSEAGHVRGKLVLEP